MEKLYREYFIIIIFVNQNKDDGMGKALLVIDMQNGFRHEPSEAILDNIIKLVKGFDGKVIFTLFVDVPNSMFETELNWPKFQSEEAQRLFKELEPIADGKLEVKHKGYTVLTDELRDIFKENNIDTVYLSGVYTDVCIVKTAMDLFDEGFKTKIVANACASLHGDNNHKYAIDSLKHIIGKGNVI